MTLSIGFVYRPENPYLNGMRAQINMRKFFFDALPRHAEVAYYGAEDTLDLSSVARNHDAWIFFDAVHWGVPGDLQGVDKLRGLKLCWIGDCHGAQKACPTYGRTKLEMCRHWSFDAYFFQHTPEYFYRFFPQDWTYWWVPMGVDAGLYRDVIPWGGRNFGKVLLTGVLGPEFYPLRTALAKSERVLRVAPGSYRGQNYTPGPWDGEQYKGLLETWAGAVASGYSVVNKYFEIPAAGCLTFAHVDDNGCGIIDFRDGETAVLVTQENAEQRIAEFLAESAHPKWARIAAAGRRFVMERYTHDHTARDLVARIELAI